MRMNSSWAGCWLWRVHFIVMLAVALVAVGCGSSSAGVSGRSDGGLVDARGPSAGDDAGADARAVGSTADGGDANDSTPDGGGVCTAGSTMCAGNGAEACN